MSDRREIIAGVLMLAAIVAALVLSLAGIGYGWGPGLALVAFIAGALLMSDS